METNTPSAEININWYHYLAAFFAGVFLANFIPHFVHGVSGLSFPTLCGLITGEKNSSATYNILYACINLLIGYILLRASKASPKNKLLMLFLFLGIVSIGVLLSYIIKVPA